MKTIELIDLEGVLALPNGANRMLFYHYIEGDVDSIAWPLPSDQREMLKSAVFDARETEHIDADVDTISLPDGELISIDGEWEPEPSEGQATAEAITGSVTTYLNQAAFTIETVAHLRGLETELLPIAEQLRAFIEKLEPRG